MDSILPTPPTLPLPSSTTTTQTIQRVVSTPGGDKVLQWEYAITLYNQNGKLTTSTQVTRIDYRV